MNVIDTSDRMLSAFASGAFDLEKWEAYMDACIPGAKEICLQDMRDSLRAGLSWRDDILPVISAVLTDTEKRQETVRLFREITDGLEKRIVERFGRTLDADVILYLGMCSGAGWVTPVNGRICVLLGIEKIMELDWCQRDRMNGLILHELGHVYHTQYGVTHKGLKEPPERFLWQLFSEGIATVFEQELVGDPDYFHQDQNGWKQWCRVNALHIRDSFCNDLPSMTGENQRYFGDRVSFDGHADTGYYLGTRFVRYILRSERFDRVISYSVGEIKEAFDRFMRSDG